MNKYNIGQELFWIKYVDNWPTLLSFEVGCIKQMKDGFKYGTGTPGCSWIKECQCFSSIDDAVKAGVDALEKMLDDEVNK